MDKIALLDGKGGNKQQAEEIKAALRAFTNSGKGGKGEGEGEDVAATRRKLEALTERFAKAKLFIKEQDKLLQQARAGKATSTAASTSSSSDAGSSSLDDANSVAALGGEEQSSLRKELEAVKMERDYMMGAWWLLVGRLQHQPTSLTKADGRGGVVGAEGARSWLGQQQRRGMTVAWALGRR